MKTAIAVSLTLLMAATALAIPPATESFLLSVGHGAGAGGSQWRSDVWVHNPSATQAATVDIFFLPRTTGAGANVNPTSRRITVEPGDTRELVDIVLSQFALSNAFGGLRFSSNVPVVVTGRIYDANVSVLKNSTPTLGTTGQFYPGLAGTLAIAANQSTDVIGLAEDAGARSNLSFAEVTGNSATLRIDRIDASGNVVGTATDSIGAYGVRQINKVLETLGGAATANQRVKVTVTGGSGKVLVAASRLDNVTNDPYTIEMVTAAGGGVARTTGRFDGLIYTSDGSRPDGGLTASVTSSGLAAFAGSAGIPCPTDLDGVAVDFTNSGYSTTPPLPAAIGSNGTFSVQVSIGYSSDGSNTVFTTLWTLAGTLADGVLAGTLRSETSGGTGDYASCNGTATRNWRAGWTGAL